MGVKRIALYAALLTMAALGGCAATMEAANEAGGIVNLNYNMGQAAGFQKANEHCQKFGKVARVTAQNEIRNTLAFDCVTP